MIPCGLGITAPTLMGSQREASINHEPILMYVRMAQKIKPVNPFSIMGSHYTRAMPAWPLAPARSFVIYDSLKEK